MAGSAIIGALRVILGADTAAFEDGLKHASGKLDSFGSSATKIGAAIGVAMAGALTALGVAVAHSVDKIDSLGKAAQKAGAPIEEFSALASSAGKVKIGVDELAGAMEKLAKNMGAIAAGGKTTDAGRAFQALGISVKDAEGNLKSSSSVITELASKFENFADTPARTALAIAIFGKAGAEMIPLLLQGSAALKKQADDMRELGLIIDNKTFKAAEQFNQSLNRLGKIQDSIIMKLTVGMLPAMNDVATALVNVSKDADALAAVGKALGVVFKVSIEEGLKLALGIKQIVDEIKTFIDAGKLAVEGIEQLVNKSKELPSSFGGASGAIAGAVGSLKDLRIELNSLPAAWELFRTQMDVTKSSAVNPMSLSMSLLTTAAAAIRFGLEKLAEAAPKFGEAFDLVAASQARAAQQSADLKAKLEVLFGPKTLTDAKSLAEILDEVQAQVATIGKPKTNAPTIVNTEALDKFIKTTERSMVAQRAEAETVGQVAGAKERLRTVEQAGLVALQSQITLTPELTEKIRLLGENAAATALTLEGMQLKWANTDPLVRYQTELANTEAALNKVGATQDQLARNAKEVAEKFQIHWTQVASNISGTAGALSQLTGVFAKENKAMGIASKAFALGQIAINTAIAVTKANTLLPPANFAAIAFAIATGAAQAATVLTQSFAKGGSFMVPGGMSGTDNKFVPLNLASGERVDITPANEVGRPGRSGNTVIELHGDKFSRDQVRELFETINSGLADGHKFKVA